MVAFEVAFVVACHVGLRVVQGQNNVDQQSAVVCLPQGFSWGHMAPSPSSVVLVLSRGTADLVLQIQATSLCLCRGTSGWAVCMYRQAGIGNVSGMHVATCTAWLVCSSHTCCKDMCCKVAIHMYKRTTSFGGRLELYNICICMCICLCVCVCVCQSVVVKLHTLRSDGAMQCIVSREQIPVVNVQ